MMNPIAIRLLNQQLASPQFSDPAELVSHLGAVQAQEYRLMRWAVAMRTKKPSTKDFKKTFDSGKIVRLHLMRWPSVRRGRASTSSRRLKQAAKCLA